MACIVIELNNKGGDIMNINIEYIQAIDKWTMTINGQWIITAASVDMVMAALCDRLPILERTVKSA